MSIMQAPAVIGALRAHHFAGSAWAVLEQVSNSTGSVGGRKRWLDLVAMSLWPSRGLELHGVEVKVSRSDWRRERDDPSKADDVAKYCHRFYVAAPAGVVPLDEVPPAWGLIEITDKAKTKVAKKAELLEPKPPTWVFVAALLRRAAESHDDAVKRAVADQLEAAVEAASSRRTKADLEAAVTDAMAAERRRASDQAHELGNLKARIEAFERAAGVKLEDVPAWRLRQALLLNATADDDGVERLRRRHETIGRALAVLEGLDAGGTS